jgi:hypothetical protein
MSTMIGCPWVHRGISSANVDPGDDVAEKQREKKSKDFSVLWAMSFPRDCCLMGLESFRDERTMLAR